MKISLLFLQFLQLAQLRIAPQDIPKNDRQLVLVMIVYFMVSAFTCQLYLSESDVLKIAGLDTVLLLVFIYICLGLCGFVNRWSQTVTAVAGAGILIGLVALPFMIITHQMTDDDFLKSIIGLVMLALLLWNIMVNAHIFRHAFSVHLPGGIAISVMYFLLLNSLILAFTPEYLQT